MRVLVLGAGPAGLMAAHAATIAGHDVKIVSKDRKSYMRGAQYLHLPIPMVSGAPFQINYSLQGEVAGYRQKVYGDIRVQVSPESLVGTHSAWDIREAYDALWEMYGKYITDYELHPLLLQEIMDKIEPDYVINTIPLPSLCISQDHLFSSETVWVTEQFRYDPEALGGSGDNVVVCNGERDVPWYRTSRIHGWENTEYPEHTKPPLSADKVHKVIKPLKTNCVCDYGLGEGRWINAGRYGTWTKGVLSHSAFYDTLNLMTNKEKMELQNQ